MNKATIMEQESRHCVVLQALVNGLKRCLDLCVQQKYTSVAFPVIGPGIVLKYPLSEAIQVLTKEIKQFGLTASSSSVVTIHVVIKPDDPTSEEASVDALSYRLTDSFCFRVTIQSSVVTSLIKVASLKVCFVFFPSQCYHEVYRQLSQNMNQAGQGKLQWCKSH